LFKNISNYLVGGGTIFSIITNTNTTILLHTTNYCIKKTYSGVRDKNIIHTNNNIIIYILLIEIQTLRLLDFLKQLYFIEQSIIYFSIF